MGVTFDSQGQRLVFNLEHDGIGGFCLHGG